MAKSEHERKSHFRSHLFNSVLDQMLKFYRLRVDEMNVVAIVWGVASEWCFMVLCGFRYKDGGALNQ